MKITQILKKAYCLPLFLLFFCCSLLHAETIKILAIGNSFSEDAVENYLYDIAKADGTTLIIGNMYIAGCDLATHLNNIKGNNSEYSYRKINETGEKVETNNTTLLKAITDENWDYITFQQASHHSGMYETYYPHFTELLSYVKEKATNPNVRYAIHMTWAYQQNTTHSGFENYGKDQQTMYEAIVETIHKVAEDVNIDIIIPAGTAVQNGRTSFVGDTYCRDGYHLDYGVGRYTVACTWYQTLFDNSVLENTYRPAGIISSKIEVAKKAAHYAVENPKSITTVEVIQNLPDAGTFILSSPINIDFGTGSKVSADPWNNITSVAAGTNIHGLYDMEGEITPIKIEIIDPFGNINQDGPTSGVAVADWDLPSTATSDSFWGNAGNTFEGKNIVTASVLVSELNPALTYNFKVFSSRSGTDIRQMSVTVEGKNKKLGYIDSSGNYSLVVAASGIIPDEDGTIKITFGAGPENNNQYKFFYVNALQITSSKQETPGVLTQKFYFDFGYENQLTNDPDENNNYWNNITSAANNGSLVKNLINTENATSPYSLSVTSKFALNNTSPGGLLNPDKELLGDMAVETATRDYFFVEGGAGSKGVLKIGNLDVEKGYKFYLFGSRAASSASDIRTTLYRLTGLNSSYGNLLTTAVDIEGEGTKQNLSEFFVSDMLYPNANGEIIIEVSRLKDASGQYAYLGMMRMEEYDNVVEERPIPVTLQVIDYSKGRIPDFYGGESEQNVFAWLSHDMNTSGWTTPFYGDENNLTGTVKALIKEEDRWIWSATILVPAGDTYSWNPYFGVPGEHAQVNLISIDGFTWPGEEGKNLYYTVAEDGTISGLTTLIIPYFATIASSEIAGFEPGSLQGAQQVTLTGNYAASDMEVLQQALGTNQIITTINIEGVAPATDSYFIAINPNCLKYITGSAPDDGSNYINRSTNQALTPMALTDGTPFNCPEEVIASMGISYTRDCYIDGGWESLILPFAVSEFTNSEKFVVEEYTETANTTIRFAPINVSEWEANRAYILKYKEGIEGTQTCIFKGAVGAPVVTSPIDEVFTGVYSLVSGEGKYLLAADGQSFGRGSVTSTVPAFRAYLESLSGNDSPRYRVEHDNGGDITSIDEIKVENIIYSLDGVIYVLSSKMDTVSIYSIEGRKVMEQSIFNGINTIEGLAKGIYIVDNQKVVVK